MKKLLLVDGSNMVMRAAFGGQVPPAEAVPIATGLIRRAVRQCGASHVVVALDSVSASWRKQEFPEYKAQRTTDTSPWIRAAQEHWRLLGWCLMAVDGFEADDVIATLARRGHAVCPVVVLSGDSDLLTLLADGIEILKPLDGGRFLPATAEEVCSKYNVRPVSLLTHLKALTGESGDNIPGVPGIGPVRGSALLNSYGGLEDILAAGEAGKCRYSMLAHEHREAARRAFRLVSLSFDAPILPIKPRDCFFPMEARPNA